MNPGKYQQYVNELPDLELYRYENIFKVFETADNNYLYYNILKTVKIPKDINSEIFYTVQMNNNVPFTTLSFQMYGTTHLWWLICLINNISNPFATNNSGKLLKVVKKVYLKTILDSIKQQLQ